MNGKQMLQRWFGLSYAGFIVLPRVTCEQMPDEWQRRLADLLEEYDDTYEYVKFHWRVAAVDPATGKYMPVPEYLKNYRRPDIVKINDLRHAPEDQKCLLARIYKYFRP